MCEEILATVVAGGKSVPSAMQSLRGCLCSSRWPPTHSHTGSKVDVVKIRELVKLGVHIVSGRGNNWRGWNRNGFIQINFIHLWIFNKILRDNNKENSLKVQHWKYCKRSGENHIHSWNMCEKRQQLGARKHGFWLRFSYDLNKKYCLLGAIVLNKELIVSVWIKTAQFYH